MRERLSIILSSVAVFILLAGGGLIFGTYFYSSVPRPAGLSFHLRTSLSFM